MSSPSAEPLLEVEKVGDATVVRFTRRTILDHQSIDAVGRQLLSLVGEGGCRKAVLNFARVESLTSAMLGKLITFHRQAEAGGGRVVFCKVDPFLQEIFKIIRLPDFIRIYGEEEEALRNV